LRLLGHWEQPPTLLRLAVLPQASLEILPPRREASQQQSIAPFQETVAPPAVSALRSAAV